MARQATFDRAGVDGVGGYAVVVPAARGLDREQGIGGLGLPVGQHRVVRARDEVQVVEVQWGAQVRL